MKYSRNTMLAAAGSSATATRRSRIVRRGIIGAATTAALVGGMAGSAYAAPGGSTTANVAVDSGITMTGLTSSFTLAGTPGATVTGTGVVAFNVETNNAAGYTVTVQSTGATMLPPTGNSDSIPIAALTVRESGAGSFSPLSNAAAVTVHSQGVRSANGGDNLANDYRIRIPVVSPDTYSATLNYLAATL